ncbi:MAG: hypothetical protein QG594_991 [Bacteroidota bacterium]|nr:hypothetical protein [Bacteroidota bacterium]
MFPTYKYNPLISVITVVYNDESHIEDTIKSIINQTYKNIEYIIIDGKSTDNTNAIINKYINFIKRYISEKDQGIYDAMNKGIKIANGEWIIFMNSGDKFYSETILSELHKFLFSGYQLIYGKVEICYASGLHYIKNTKSLEKLKYGMPFCHQSLLIDAPLMKKHRYKLDDTHSSIFNFIVDCYLERCKFYDSGLIVSSYRAHGVSDTNRVMILKSWQKIAQKLNHSTGRINKWHINIYYWYVILLAKLKHKIKLFLPKQLTMLIIKFIK